MIAAVQRPPLMTCLYQERGHQLYLVNGVPTVWHNWNTRKKEKDGTWTVTPHEEVFTLSDWQPSEGTQSHEIKANMTAAYNELFALR